MDIVKSTLLDTAVLKGHASKENCSQVADGTMYLDLRITFETDDGAFIFGQGKGVWRSDPEKSPRPEGEPAQYGDMYIMSTQTFETGDERYKWLNDMVFVAEGKMDPVTEEGYMAHISWQVYAVVNN